MRRGLAGSLAVLLGVALAPAMLPAASAAPVGQGFNLNSSDLSFILKQIKISEAHATREGPAGEPVAGTPLLGPGPNQVGSPRLPFGLRSVDGRDNNLVAGQEGFGAADRPFPRTLTSDYRAPYAPTGNVTDAQPRQVSNLVVDQTITNPSAVQASGLAPAELPAAGVPLDLPNVAPDVGLSAPYNSWFTIFGQFFDHGLDLIGKSGSTVFVPLAADDPLCQPTCPNPPFMLLTRAAGGGSGSNSTSSFIDQSQTYTSHPAHQAFLREYTGAPGAATSTGRMLTEAAGGLGTWKGTKAQSATMLGITLADKDVLNVPLLATDQYGRFLRGLNGFAQLVMPPAPGTTGNTLLEGVAGGLAVPDTAVRTGHAFLDDIAHNAAPTGTKTADDDAVVNGPGPVQAGRYDNEMLDEHFVAGDGRVNENIALTAVHHVFHSEHNRLAGPSTTPGSIANLLAAPGNEALKADWDNAPKGTGERLFQAAKFVTEMEYQHLAFEEFARKVQPQVNLFGAYDTSIDPAISAEFAHVVYRFGHSMLTETVPRKNPNGTDAGSLSLLAAFLDPTKYDDSGARTPDEAAGSLVRGLTREVGQELDEFVTEALRNKLLGLPLDLATLNMARGRETGVPRLNEARRQFFAKTGEPALQPYASWADFGFSIKHQASLVNFVAAYGTHPSITGDSAAKRQAADALVNGDRTSTTTPTDADAFVNSTAPWTAATSGLNDVDFWVGGLAEKQQPFGGLLGNTFNFVFETQMERLQDGDRFYYLSRTAGLNLLTQLEGNSFAELISRNTDASGLPADSFSRPDFILNMDALLAAPTGITNDPATEVDEANRLIDPGKFLTRTGNRLRYSGPAHVVFNGVDVAAPDGAPVNDDIIASEGDDTIRGNGGNDRAEGGAGNDNLIGGDGDDILTDTFGDDVNKGGDGDDYMSSGQGFDLNQGGLGQDFIAGGSDPTETFGGPGNDMIIAGGSADTVFGDDGDDWIEGGTQNDLLQGDNGAPFQDDVNEAGHDVIRGDGGDDDYDAEGGDDIMVGGPGIERNEGMRGFDWTVHKGDPQAANDDMNFTGLLPDTLDTLRDRFDLTESLSGWNLDDVLRGDSRLAADMLGHELNAAGVARVPGLQTVLGGATSFTNGNIVLGGAGSDLLEGRGGNDVLDGDAWLDVQLQAPGQAPADSMGQYQAAVAAGTLDAGTITIARTVLPGSPGTNDFDSAVFSGPRADYDFTPNAKSMVVVHARGTLLDGTDTVRNVERLTFADGTLEITPIPGNTPATGTVTISDTTPSVGQVLTATPAINDPDGVGGILFNWQQETPADVWTTVSTNPTFTPTADQVGLRLRVQATFLDGQGVNESVNSAATSAVASATTVPTAPTAVSAVAGNASATVSWTAPSNAATSGITGYRIRPYAGGSATPGTATLTSATVTSAVVNGLVNGTSYTFDVTALSGTVEGAVSGPSPAVIPVAPVVNPPPTVTARVPAVNAPAVAVGANITATFSEPVTGVSGTTFQLTNATTNVVVPAPAPTLVAGTNRWVLNPTGNLTGGTLYRVTLTGGPTDIRDAGGAPLTTVTWTFTTAGAANPVPTVTARAPGVNATGVALGANVTATFSEPVQGVDAATFQLTNAASGAVVPAAAPVLVAGTNRWLLNPTGNLAALTQYRVTLTGGATAIRDSSGQPLTTVTWTFTTR